jgi:Cu+-exporting ATPase
MAIVAPIGVLIGSGRALQAGILFKSGEQIELAHDVNTVVVNKTSLTQGKSVVTDIQIIGGYHEQDWLQWVASVESKAQHPIGRAIVQKAKAKGLSMLPVEPFSALPGYGVHGKVAGHAVTIGTRKLLRQQNVSFASAEATIQSLEARGKTVVLIAIDQTYAGLIAIDDPLKPSVETAVKQLTKNGVGVHLLTADSYRTAQAIAQQTGIKHVIAEVLPSHKGAEIQRLRQQGKKVAMIGDATTDADALAKADLGIVLTTEPGSHLDRRQLTLLSGDLSQLVDVIQLSRQIIRNIKRGFHFALAYHLIGIPLAALGFLAPWCAVFVMVCSSIAIVGNAFYLQRKKKTTLDIGCGKAPSM